MFNFVRRKERLQSLRDTVAGGYSLQFRADPKSLRELYASLDNYEPRARRLIMRNALRKWSAGVAVRMAANAYKNAHQTRSHVLAKVKLFRRAIWCGVGVETGVRPPGQVLKGRYGDLLPGWRSHLYEVGWTPYPKDFIGDENRRAGKGRGWRRGLRKRKAPLRYKVRYMSRAYFAKKNELRPELERSISDYNRKLSRSSERAARRASR